MKNKSKRVRAVPDPVDRPDRCRALKKNGEPCRVFAGLSDAGLCMHHDPERTREARAMRRKGGKASAARTRDPVVVPHPLETPNDAVLWSSWIATAVAGGVLDARRAMEATRAVNTFLKSYDAAKKIRELERQLKDAVKRLKERSA